MGRPGQSSHNVVKTPSGATYGKNSGIKNRLTVSYLCIVLHPLIFNAIG
jgi:hypothetical protein